METIFISDLHLSDKREDLLLAFKNFLLSIPYNTNLIIIGDLFDYYIGIDKQDKAQNLVKESLNNAFKERHIKTFFIRGNRDFLMSKKEALYFNMELLDDIHIINTSYANIAITHGDKLCTKDISYIKYRKIVDLPISRCIFALFPFFLKKKLANSIRNKSKNTKRTFSKQDMEKYNITLDGLNNLVKEYKVDTLLHGHIHIFKEYKDEVLNLKKRISLGAWDKNYSYIKVGLDMITFKEESIDKLIK